MKQMKRLLLIPLLLGAACFCIPSGYAKTPPAGCQSPDDSSQRTKSAVFYLPGLDSLTAGTLCSSLPVQYQDKISNCLYVPSDQAIQVSFRLDFPEIEILQIFRLHGYAAYYYSDPDVRVSLDGSGQNTISEHIKH